MKEQQVCMTLKLESTRKHLDEKIAHAIDTIFYDFEGMPIVYIKVLCIFHPRNVTHRNRSCCSNGTTKPQEQGEKEEELQ